MKNRFFTALLILTHFAFPISAHFFPNVSSIPSSVIHNLTAGAWNGFQKFAGCHSGQKVDGLAKLKKYFQYFGYIVEKSNGNFSDEFDDDLGSAIKTYQLNFNLNVTGELDENTIRQILRPRCGVADVVNGSSSMNSGKTPSPGTIHLRTVAHYSFFPGRPRWPASRRELTYAFLPENQLSDSVRTVFSNAFDRWSEVTPLTFTETTSLASADIRIGFFSGDHGDGEPFDGVMGTLAHAFSPPAGRLHLDSDESWLVNGDSIGSPGISAIDLESVAVHEIGHLLGLGHSSLEEAIMYPSISAGMRKVELAGDDIQGIQVLYGSNPNNFGSPLPTPTWTEDRNYGVNVMGPCFFLWAVGFITFFIF